jgi:hypothetical protein
MTDRRNPAGRDDVKRIGVAAHAAAAAGLAAMVVCAYVTPAAASSDSVTVDHASSITIRSQQAVSVAGLAAAYCKRGLTTRSASLTLSGPTGNQTIATSGQVPCNRDISLSKAIAAPARNGGYLVRLDSHGVQRAATLDVLIPPARPAGFGVSTSGTVASFTWSANSEPDLAAYQIVSSSGGVLTSASPGGACGGAGCSTSVDLGPDAAGTTQRFSVRAVRCGMSCGDDVIGPSSAPATATFAAPDPGPSPTPSPTPTHSSGGVHHGGGHHGGSGGPGDHPGQPSGGGGAGHRTAGGHGAKHAAVPTATPRANRLHKAHGKIAKIRLHNPVQPVDAHRVTQQHSPAPAAPKPAAQTITRAVSVGLQPAPVWRGLAAVAILLLIGVHIATWARRVETV